MKLIQLTINNENGFRALQKGFTIHFQNTEEIYSEQFYPRILTGRNGSGKSNILEALANIFYHLDCIYCQNLPTSFRDDEEGNFNPAKCLVDAYELEYQISVDDLLNKHLQNENHKIAHVKITKQKYVAPIITWENSLESFVPDRTIINYLLPSHIVAYTSGENDLLTLPFFKTRFLKYDEYADLLSKDIAFPYPPKSETRLTLLDKNVSQAIFLTNLLTQPDEVLDTLSSITKIEKVEEFRLIIHETKYIRKHESRIQTERNEKKSTSEFIELTQAISKSVRKLEKCATCYGFKEFFDENHPSQEGQVGEDLHYYLVLDFKVTEATRKAFSTHFSPLELFELFQILLDLNAYVVTKEDKETVYWSDNIFINEDIYPSPLERDRILRFKNFKIKKQGINELLYTKQLSDGEHQLLHALGLALLFKNENALFLLDEPETHFNPDWKAQFISILRQCFQGSTAMQEMLITTHSPYLISDSESKYVHVFDKDDETDEVTCQFPEFQTLGTSINKITIRLFDKANTIGAFANKRLDELKEEFNDSEDKVKFLAKANNLIGDSVEKVMFMNYMLDQIENK